MRETFTGYYYVKLLNFLITLCGFEEVKTYIYIFVEEMLGY